MVYIKPKKKKKIEIFNVSFFVIVPDQIYQRDPLPNNYLHFHKSDESPPVFVVNIMLPTHNNRRHSRLVCHLGFLKGANIKLLFSTYYIPNHFLRRAHY